MKHLMLMLTLVGLTGCAIPSESAVCDRSVPLAEEARDVLLANEKAVPGPVGEAVTPLIIAVLAGC